MQLLVTRVAPLLCIAVTLLLHCFVAISAAKSVGSAPKITHTYFKEPLSKLLYFKDPAKLLGIDRTNGKLHRSADSGAHWELVEEIPAGKAARLYAHPFEPKIAYALSSETEHWVTRDEGKTWQAFSTPLPPTSSGERPLSFHADRTGWIMFIAERCTEETGGWWPLPRIVCADEPYYTRDGFEKAVADYRKGDRSGAGLTALLGENKPVVQCIWARHTKEFEAMAEEAIFCLEVVSKNTTTTTNTRRQLLTHPTVALPKLHTRSMVGQHTQRRAAHPDDGTSLVEHDNPGKRSISSDIGGILDSLFTQKTVQMVLSEDFFSTKRTVHFGAGNDGTGGDRAGGGVLAVSVVKNYVLAAISHAHSEEMDLFVSMDGVTWAESHLPLPPGAEEDAYTILESTEHAIFVDVLTATTGATSTLFRSNSNGTYYTQSLEHTHRSSAGVVDFERVQGVQGVVIANQVSNWEKTGGIFHRDKLELRSRISFNDGARWRFLVPPANDAQGKSYRCSKDAQATGECSLHLHSLTSSRARGKIFGEPAASGTVLAVGSVGPKLLKWGECDVFLSRDAGLSWSAVHAGAHHVQLADSGSVLVLLSDNDDGTDEVRYSLDGGDSWQSTSLGKEKVRVSALFVDDDGLSPTVIAVGTAMNRKEQVVVAIDFTDAWGRRCAVNPKDPVANADMESFVLVAHEDNDCVMGHRSEHIRRKPKAQCTLRLDQVLLPRQEDCRCTAHDFECDYNYAPTTADNRKCELVGNEVIPKGQCLHEGDRFQASSGYRLIPGNTCLLDDKGSEQLDRPIDKPCPRVQTPGSGDHNHNNNGDHPAATGSISHHTLALDGDVHVMAFPNTTSYLLMTSAQELYRSDDEGLGWTRIDLARSTGNSKIGKPVYLAEHQYDNKRAFIYTDADTMAFTGDRGASWATVRNLPGAANGLRVRPLVDFNPTHPDWLLFVGGTTCPGCHTEFWASRDNGATWNRFTTHATKCRFAQASEFSSLPEEAIVCTNYKLTSGKDNEQDAQHMHPSPGNYIELLVFPTPFTDTKHYAIDIPDPEHNEIVGFHVYSRFIVAAVVGTDKTLRLFVSDDGRTAHAARFPPGTNIRAEGFTLLPSHAGTILIDVEGAPNTGDPEWGTGWGTLFASNTNGSHFHRVLRHTNRNRLGTVDVERVAGLSGVLVANRVLNADALSRAGVRKELQTVASWDDGRSWHTLRPPAADSAGKPIDCDDCSLNLYSQSSLLSSGAAYGAAAAPGLLIGVGSVGARIGRYADAKTFISTDGGVAWTEIHAAQAQSAVGDHGSLLVLVDDTAPVDTLQYSYDSGATWHTHRFVDTAGVRIVVEELLDGGSMGGGQRITLVGREVTSSGVKDRTAVVTVDFTALHERQCRLDSRDHTNSDFELWTPRWEMDRTGSAAPICSLGVATSYWRRKKSAACYVGNEFDPPETRTRTCECAWQDFECDEGFWLDDYGRCELDGPDPHQPAGCSEGSTYKGRSGYRKIAQSQCTGGDDLAAPIDRICGRAGGIHASATEIDAPVAELVYFGESRHAVLRTEKGSVLVSLNEGGSGQWAALPMPDSSQSNENDGMPRSFSAVVQQPYAGDRAYFVPSAGTVALYTDDAGRTTRPLHLPALPSPLHHPALLFHPEYPDWLIFLAQPRNGGCTSTSDCLVEAFVSRDHGAHWSTMLTPVGAGGCAFVRTDRLTAAQRNLIVCARHPAARDGEGDVLVSADWFRTSDMLVRNATDFAIMGEFLLVSQSADEGRALTLHVSLDGRTATEARFPGNKRTFDAAYTVLEPPEGFEYRDARGRNQKMPGGGVMLHVTTSSQPGREWGTIYASNSNGTYYRRSLELVNRDESGLVDFERIRALEGVAIANIVSNPDAVREKGVPKQLRTMVTVDAGSRWHYLRVSDRTPCTQTAPRTGGCALHLHGYTEVSDPENIYSASGAPGLLMGVGNVGTHLERIGASDTYLSDDGGATWRSVRKGPKWHEFGDHGSLIVVADRIHPVSEVEYSLDRGASWLPLPLPHDAQGVRVEALTTVPDSTSRRFVLHGRRDGSPKGIVVGLDFTGAQPRICVLDEKKQADGSADFELFHSTPIDPQQSDESGCLLGRKAQYYRRKPDRACYIGNEFEPVRYISETCECTVRDYECNHNFVRKSTGDDDPWGQCVLVEGMKAPRTNCTNAEQEYFVIESAYRKIPQSICQGGMVLDKATEVWCPGRARTVALLWALVLPVVCLGLAYVAYNWWRDRYPYFRLEDIGAAVRPAIYSAARLPNANSGLLKQIEPVFFGALSTAGAVASATKEGFLWGLDRAAPYLPSRVQRWSYEHPPRWGTLLRAADGRPRNEVRRGEGSSRFTYRPLRTSESGPHLFSAESHGLDVNDSASDIDEYDAVESGFNHFLEEENLGSNALANSHIGAGEDDARPVDRQILFANTELSDDETNQD
ncbi:vacuolar protein sorting/targeting protein PEP1 [Coemansia sp. RSA 986]|nr:vacuolar protein sorting/targeting protein PEP1 [Coemansia sp. RSA 986]